MKLLPEGERRISNDGTRDLGRSIARLVQREQSCHRNAHCAGQRNLAGGAGLDSACRGDSTSLEEVGGTEMIYGSKPKKNVS